MDKSSIYSRDPWISHADNRVKTPGFKFSSTLRFRRATTDLLNAHAQGPRKHLSACHPCNFRSSRGGASLPAASSSTTALLADDESSDVAHNLQTASPHVVSVGCTPEIQGKPGNTTHAAMGLVLCFELFLEKPR